MSRKLIVDTAERVVRTGGYEEMTIRSLAAELGVAPMSLYRYVRDKDDLLSEVVDRLLTRRWRPCTAPDDWMTWTAEAARRFRDFLVSQPVALHVYLQHPVVSPAAIARMDAMLEVLRSTGLDEELAIRAYGTIHVYTIGFAALEASRARSTHKRADTSDDAAFLATFTTSRQFDEGLLYLLEGIERQRAAAKV